MLKRCSSFQTLKVRNNALVWKALRGIEIWLIQIRHFLFPYVYLLTV